MQFAILADQVPFCLINSCSASHNHIWIPNTSLSIKRPVCWCIEWQNINCGMRIISIPNSIFLQAYGRLPYLCLSPTWFELWLWRRHATAMPDNGIFWMCSDISVIVYRHMPMQLLIRIAGWVMVWAIRDCIPLRRLVPDNSMGTTK